MRRISRYLIPLTIPPSSSLTRGKKKRCRDPEYGVCVLYSLGLGSICCCYTLTSAMVSRRVSVGAHIYFVRGVRNRRRTKAQRPPTHIYKLFYYSFFKKKLNESIIKKKKPESFREKKKNSLRNSMKKRQLEIPKSTQLNHFCWRFSFSNLPRRETSFFF